MLERGRADFPGADGQTLAARIDPPIGAPRGWALFAHCFSCSKDLKSAGRIAQKLAESGVGVMRFDFTGLGLSEGEFANTNFSTNVQDLLAAADWLKDKTGGPQLLIGHSLGGAAAIVAAGQIDTVKAVATIAAPSQADHVLDAFAVHLDQIEEEGEAEVSLAGRPFMIRHQFVEDVRGAKVEEAAGALKRALLILHSPLDETVGIENATGLFLAARHPKSFISLDTASHLLTEPEDADYVGETIAAWSHRYLGQPALPEVEEPTIDAADVIARETGEGKFQTALTIGRHELLADEPARVGGEDTGPDPYAFVTAGLGACTAMTLRMYAARKDWPLERVTVALNHAKDHAEDCAHCEQGQKVDVFERTVFLEGDLTEEQRSRLLEIADKCPVHRTLETANLVRTRLGDVQSG